MDLPLCTTFIEAPIFPLLYLDYFKLFLLHISLLLIGYFTILLIRFFATCLLTDLLLSSSPDQYRVGGHVLRAFIIYM
jgi:hypothetical protein